MHTEQIGNLHPGWVVGGWLIAVAVTSAVYLALVGAGLFPQGGAAVLGVAVAMAVGFFVGGLFVGLRWVDAPVLHGAAITLVSVLVWFLGSLALPANARGWSNSTSAALGLILLQLVASAAGGWTGRRMSLGGATVD
ncbi:MAG TPA: hypothetical protein VLA36_10275 [Longimicrobiales bacterium]|nr:hypothetical protein [Longimicrobiales bacterium]